MKCLHRKLAALVLGGGLLAANAAWAQKGAHDQQKHHHKTAAKAVPAPAAEPEVPATPAPPLPKDEPAVAPEVSYTGGRLTIMARNSTLSDVLKEVEKRTGATFDISSGDTSERVVGLIGPGQPRDVLATLLNGSHFNYVMLSPLGDPSALTHVLLTPRGAAAPETANAQPLPPQQYAQPVQISPALQIQQQQNPTGEVPAADNSTENQDENADGQAQDQAEGQTDAQPDAAQQGIQAQPGVKTPEQLLQELRQQQQQLQQPQAAPPNDQR